MRTPTILLVCGSFLILLLAVSPALAACDDGSADQVCTPAPGGDGPDLDFSGGNAGGNVTLATPGGASDDASPIGGNAGPGGDGGNVDIAITAPVAGAVTAGTQGGEGGQGGMDSSTGGRGGKGGNGGLAGDIDIDIAAAVVAMSMPPARVARRAMEVGAAA